MGLLWAIILGLVLGLLAKALLPGERNLPLWLTAVAGVAGGLVGNYLAAGIGVADTRGVDWIRHLLQLAGAVVCVAVGDALWHNSAKRRP